jgi:hypothetical protein
VLKKQLIVALAIFTLYHKSHLHKAIKNVREKNGILSEGNFTFGEHKTFEERDPNFPFFFGQQFAKCYDISLETITII